MAKLNKIYILLLLTSLAALVQNSEAVDTVYPTINCIIDYSVYESHNFNEQEIARDFTHIWTNVKALYKKIPAPKIELVYRGCLILKTQNAADFVDDSLHAGSQMVDANLALKNFGRYLSSPLTNVGGQANINVLFTNYKLCIEDCGRKNTVGLANVASACLDISNAVGVIKVQEPHNTVHTVAHELAHMLGAHHDGDNNYCNPKNFIMTPTHQITGVSYATPNPLNEYEWSSCTVNMIHHYITNGQGQCLPKQSNVNYGDGKIDSGVKETDDDDNDDNDDDDVYKTKVEKIKPLINPTPPPKKNDDDVQTNVGNKFSLDGALLLIDNECKNNGASGICADEYKDKNICKPVVCVYQHSFYERWCKTIDSQVPQNSPCGDNKICVDGYCVDVEVSNKSPDFGFDDHKLLPPPKQNDDDDDDDDDDVDNDDDDDDDDNIDNTKIDKIEPKKPLINPTLPPKKNDDDVQTKIGNKISFDDALLEIDNNCKENGALGICTSRYKDKNICKRMACEYQLKLHKKCQYIYRKFEDNLPCGDDKVCLRGHCVKIKVSKKSPKTEQKKPLINPTLPPKKNDDDIQTKIKNKISSDDTWLDIDNECKKNGNLGICAIEYQDENPCKKVVCEYQYSLFERRCKPIERQLEDGSSCGVNKVCSYHQCVDVEILKKSPDFRFEPPKKNDDDIYKTKVEKIEPKNPLFNPTPPPKKNDDDVQTTAGNNFSYFDWLIKIHEECKTVGALGICYSQYYDNNTCKPIMCEYPYKRHENMCKSIVRQYSKNTPCGDDKVCLNGSCVNKKVPIELSNFGNINNHNVDDGSIEKGFKEYMNSVKKAKNINKGEYNPDDFHSIYKN